MGDRKKVDVPNAIEQITPELKVALNEAKDKLNSSDRRQFMAQIVESLGPGGQRRAQRELGWNRNTIIKGTKELNSGIVCIDNFSARGRRRSEDHLPHFLDDITDIVAPVSQIDPTFRTDQCYCPLTAGEVRRRLIEEKNYSDR